MTSDHPKITGRHVFAGFAAAFAVIIGVNLWLAVSAVRTFPGLEVGNSYIASQTFDQRRAAQEALGWVVEAHAQNDHIRLSLLGRDGQPVYPTVLTAVLARPTTTRSDQVLDLVFDGRDYVADVALAPGNWNIRLDAIAEDGTPFSQRLVLIKD